MKLVVIIPTFNRRDLLGRVLRHLEGQTRPPDEVIVSAPDRSHVDAYQSKRFPISFVFGKLGLPGQRNQALDQVLGHADIVIFFDDDFLPSDHYLERLEAAFAANPDWAAAMGHAVEDGARNAGYTFDEGLELLRSAEKRELTFEAKSHTGAYGCNMSIRANMIGNLRFDERLVLYGWQEDRDFSSQLRRIGPVMALNTIFGIHLGTKSGRVSGLKMGYSQVANPVYLARKGTVSANIALRLVCRNIAANAVKSLWSEPYIDRWGRFKGNLLAASHIVRGRIEPEHILKL